MKFKNILLCLLALIVLAKIFQEKSTNQKLAWAYGSEAKTITNHDTLVLLRWGKIGQEWNLASAPIIRDLLDQSVSADDFLKTSSKQLLELRSVLYKMGVSASRIEDGGVRNTLTPIVEHHKVGITLYDQLHDAVLTNDIDEQKETMNKLSRWGQKKQNIFLPTYRRLSKVIPDNIIDETARRMQQEVANELKAEGK